jgi:hypothetical protein
MHKLYDYFVETSAFIESLVRISFVRKIFETLIMMMWLL